MEIIGWSDARKRRLKRYFTAEPCKKGHIAERLASNGECIICKGAKNSLRQKNMPPEKIKERNERWRLANMDKVRAAKKSRRAADPERFREEARVWRAKNADKVSEHNAKHYQKDLAASRARNNRRYREDPAFFRAASKRWRDAHPEERREFKHARRARELGAGGRYTKKDIEALFVAQDGLGLGCGVDFTQVPYTVDHKIPLVRGGGNDPDNLALLCQPCNASKNTRTMVEWEEWRAGQPGI